MLKKLAAVSLVGLISTIAFAQDKPKDPPTNPPAAGATKKEIAWVKDFDAAKKQAQESKKLLAVYFTGGGQAGKAFEAMALSNAKVVDLFGRLVSTKVDGEKDGKELASKYEVKVLPAVVFLDAGGEVFARFEGNRGAEDVIMFVTKATDLFAELPKIESTLKTKPDDGEANAKMAVRLAMKTKIGEAEAAIGKVERSDYKGPWVAKAWNEIGDYYQLMKKFESAIPAFAKADVEFSDTIDRGYAKISIMSCYIEKHDMKNAVKYADEILAMKGLPDEYAAFAKQVKAQGNPPGMPEEQPGR